MWLWKRRFCKVAIDFPVLISLRFVKVLYAILFTSFSTCLRLRDIFELENHYYCNDNRNITEMTRVAAQEENDNHSLLPMVDFCMIGL